MIAAFIANNRSLLANLAQTWLDAGAQTFSIWSGETMMACWPPAARSEEPSLRAPIDVLDRKLAELRVAGIASESAAKRLQMDAKLLSLQITCESDKADMASEVIHTRDQLVALYSLSQRLETSIDLSQTLQGLIDETAQILHSKTAWIAIQLEDEPYQLVCSPCRTLTPAQQTQEMDEILPHIERLKAESLSHLFIEGSQTNLLLLPFFPRGVENAFFGVQITTDYASLSPVLKLLQAIANYAGARIGNLLMVREHMELAKLHSEMELARNVQLSLLPIEIPQVTGLDIWAETRPALMVSGDFYDFIYSPDQPLTFSVGDISGKGISASMPMAMTRTLFRAHAKADPLFTPSSILASVNKALWEDFNQLAMFASLFIGQYDPSINTLMYSNAGHSPILYFPAGGKVTQLSADNIPVGILPGTTYGKNLLCLQKGDLLVIGSDGLYEASNAQDEAFGLDRLIEHFQVLSHLSAREITSGVLEAVKNFRGVEPQEDDQTLIVIKRTL